MTALRARVPDHPLVLDGLLAIALTALSVVLLATGARDIGAYHPTSIALLLLQTLPLVVRRTAPLAVLVVTAGATVVHGLQAEGSLNSSIGSLIALYTVAERYDRRTSGPLALAMALSFGTLIAYRAGVPRSLGGLVQTELSVLVTWLLGTWSRERRAYIGTVEDRAARAEREREAKAQSAVAEERERIARELHDVVTHHVSVIVIQAGAARRAIERRPADAAAAIDAIAATGRQALGDMRRMLGILGPSDHPPDGEEALEPMPGLGRLGELIESVRTAGLPVELSIEGEIRPLDPGVELSAYRIIQEALTNALKHAEGARARVVVRFETGALDVRITNEGEARSSPLTASGGRGLIGMRERVAVFGGEFSAGPVDGGFSVAARLPLDAPLTVA